MSFQPQIIVSESQEDLVNQAVSIIIKNANGSIAENGNFSLVLSGGSTPEPIYRKLSSSEYVSKIDWSKVNLFWGDERPVPPTHPDSNYRMARENLIDHLPIPAKNIYRIKGELDPQAAAAEYQTAIKTFFGDNLISFDLILLGLGDDGHTASLFPNTAALDNTKQLVVENHIGKFDTTRITLTYPAINAASTILFIVSGENKAAALKAVIEEDNLNNMYPAKGISPVNGNSIWLVDNQAAQLLSKDYG